MKIKYKNVGNINIVDCEVPTYYVIKTVGCVDLLQEDKDGKLHSAEVKPLNSRETLARMIAQALTMTETGLKNKILSYQYAQVSQ